MRSLLAPESIDVVVTSPPYNLGTGYLTYDDTVPRDDYLEWTRTWARKLQRARAQGSFFLNIGAKPSDPWVPLDVAFVMRGLFELQNVIHWVKSIAISQSDVGSRAPIDAISP